MSPLLKTHGYGALSLRDIRESDSVQTAEAAGRRCYSAGAEQIRSAARIFLPGPPIAQRRCEASNLLEEEAIFAKSKDHPPAKEGPRFTGRRDHAHRALSTPQNSFPSM